MTRSDKDCSVGGLGRGVGGGSKNVVAASMKNVVGGSNSSTHTASGESARPVQTCCYGFTVDNSGTLSEAEIRPLTYSK